MTNSAATVKIEFRPPPDAARSSRWQRIAGAAWLAIVVVGVQPATAATPPPDDIGGELRAEADGKVVQFPSLKTDITAAVQGDIASVTVVQTFVNPTSMPLNATYLFPLDKNAAVHAMRMRVGDELVTAKIERKAEARAVFETAKRDSKAAALLDQHRPNMFTQSVANLMPGQPIEVTLEYVQAVPRVDGAYQLEIPLVVGPRYMPPQRDNVMAALGRTEGSPQDAPPMREAQPAPAISGAWSFGPPPAYPPVNGLTAPATIEADRVGLRIELTAGIAIPQVSSPTHSIAMTGDDKATSRSVALAAGRTIDNRDFVLRYTLAGQSIQAGLLTHRDDKSGTLSLLLEPPAAPDEANVTPREIVFVLDTSGSMGGRPLDASKLFMQHALQSLRSNDYFRIIRFSSHASELASAPVRADTANLAQARSFVASLTADGGTEVMAGLTKAFGMAPMPGTKRILVFLSDGYVGNEAEILRMVSANIGHTRTYVFGIGTSVNHYLLSEMAHHGRGFVRVVDPTEKSEDAAIAFARKLDTTVMTDIVIDWGAIDVTAQTPAALPDLFAGDSIRVQGRFTTSGRHTIKVSGRINGRPATLPLDIELPGATSGPETTAIPLIWARSVIGDEMRQMMTPPQLRQSRWSDSDIEARVTELGLAHGLATQWTSFVAVSQKIVNESGIAARDSDVPLPMVDGVGPGAYGIGGGAGQRAGAPSVVRHAAGPVVTPVGAPAFASPNFAGGAAPEPEAAAGLAVVLASLYLAYRRRRRGAA